MQVSRSAFPEFSFCFGARIFYIAAARLATPGTAHSAYFTYRQAVAEIGGISEAADANFCVGFCAMFE
jgi:hypothetical protein